MTTAVYKLFANSLTVGPPQIGAADCEFDGPVVSFFANRLREADGAPRRASIVSNHNDALEITLGGASLLGRTLGGRGRAQKITVDPPLVLSNRKLFLDPTVSLRPAAMNIKGPPAGPEAPTTGDDTYFFGTGEQGLLTTHVLTPKQSAQYFRWTNSVAGPTVDFAKSRGATINDFTIVQTNDALGNMWFWGSDGTKFMPGVAIQAFVDATPGLDKVPGRFSIWCAPATGGFPVEQFRIDVSAIAGQTRMMIWDVDNGQMERVSVGAADSGGAGFKVLRIPN